MAISDSSTPPPEGKEPLLFRLKLWLGYHWVEDNKVRVIYRMGNYHEARGPGFYRVNDWLEKEGPIVQVGFRFGTFSFHNLSSRDPLRIGLKVATRFIFDPRTTQPEIAGRLVKLSDQTISSIVEGDVNKWLRSEVSRYFVEQIRQGQVFQEIEHEAALSLLKSPDLGRLGVHIIKFQVVEPLIPQNIEDGFEQATRWRVAVQSMQGVEDADLARYLARAMVERGGQEQYFNAADVLNALQQLPVRASTPSNVIEGQSITKKDDTPFSKPIDLEKPDSPIEPEQRPDRRKPPPSSFLSRKR